MFRTVRQDIKRIVALILTVAMVLPMNTVVKAEEGYPKWEHDNCTQLTAHSSLYYQGYYNNDLNKPIPKDYDNAETNTFGYYLNKVRMFGVGIYEDRSDSKWNDYSWVVTDFLLYDMDNDEPLTSLEINSSVTTTQFDTDNYNEIKNWTELSLFENVTDLTISGVQNIEQIAFPAPNAEKNTTGIKKLTIKNCEFDGPLDLSAYTNLEELVITNTTLAMNLETINGLSTLKNSKKYDYTNLIFQK